MSAALVSPVSPLPAPPRAEAAAFVLKLRSRGISGLGLLRAMERVPREIFAPRRFVDLARQDVALPLPFGRTMTAPGVVAAMLAGLAVEPNGRVLEIGTGSGYVTALLVALGGLVLSMERHPALAEGADRRLEAAGYGSGCGILCGDGFALDEGAGRFDRIILNGAVETLPPELLARLAPGGRLVCGRRGPDGVRLMTVTRDAEGALNNTVGAPIRLETLASDMLNRTEAPATEV